MDNQLGILSSVVNIIHGPSTFVHEMKLDRKQEELFRRNWQLPAAPLTSCQVASVDTYVIALILRENIQTRASAWVTHGRTTHMCAADDIHRTRSVGDSDIVEKLSVFRIERYVIAFNTCVVELSIEVCCITQRGGWVNVFDRRVGS
jgi:hypothetical protein